LKGKKRERAGAIEVPRTRGEGERGKGDNIYGGISRTRRPFLKKKGKGRGGGGGVIGQKKGNPGIL